MFQNPSFIYVFTETIPTSGLSMAVDGKSHINAEDIMALT